MDSQTTHNKNGVHPMIMGCNNPFLVGILRVQVHGTCAKRGWLGVVARVPPQHQIAQTTCFLASQGFAGEHQLTWNLAGSVRPREASKKFLEPCTAPPQKKTDTHKRGKAHKTWNLLATLSNSLLPRFCWGITWNDHYFFRRFHVGRVSFSLHFLGDV